MTTGQLSQLAGIIITLGAVSYAISLVWSHAIVPLYNAIIHIYHAIIQISEFMEVLPTIVSIAHEFEPNDGESLRGQVDNINIKLDNIEGQLETLVINNR